MTRRGIAAAACVLLLALAAMIHREKRRSPAEAQALLRWVDSRWGGIPHAGVVDSTAFIGRSAFTTRARVLCTPDSRSRIEYLTPPLNGVVTLQEASRLHPEAPTRDAPDPDGSRAGSPARHRRHLELLLRNYLPSLGGDGRAAGRPVYRLVLTHRRTGLVARRWWVDTATGLVLRSEDYRADGPLGVRTMYREVRFLLPPKEIAPIPPPPSDGESAVSPSEEAAFLHQLHLPPVRPRYVPIGYECDGMFRAICGYPDGSPGAHLQYSDGLRALSVFASAQAAGDTGEQMTPLPLGAMLRVCHRGARFVFIGELSEADLRRMAQSLP